jgi:hypothetical protein
MTGVASVATLVSVQDTPDSLLKRILVPVDPDAPAPTANHCCVNGENATELILARFVMPVLADFVQPVAPLGSAVDASAATPERPTPPATHHDRVPLLYTLAMIFGVTVATAFTPVSNMKFLVPGIATHDRRFVSLEKSAYARE